MTEAADSTSWPATVEDSTLGYSQQVSRGLQRRPLAGCAAFFLPHLRPGMAVLDCGCGPGSLTLEIAELVAPGQVVGIDIDPGQCDRAQALAGGRGIANVRFEPVDVYALPYPDASFDAVFSHAPVSHLAEPMHALAESRRVTGGRGATGPAGRGGAGQRFALRAGRPIGVAPPNRAELWRPTRRRQSGRVCQRDGRLQQQRWTVLPYLASRRCSKKARRDSGPCAPASSGSRRGWRDCQSAR